MAESVQQSVFRMADDAGVLTRQCRIRLLNCSRAGCLLEANTSLDVGTVGVVSTLIGGEEFEDNVQVVRCQRVDGAGSVYQVGAKFLWTSIPGRRSLRGAFQRDLAGTPGPSRLPSL